MSHANIQDQIDSKINNLLRQWAIYLLSVGYSPHTTMKYVSFINSLLKDIPYDFIIQNKDKIESILKEKIKEKLYNGNLTYGYLVAVTSFVEFLTKTNESDNFDISNPREVLAFSLEECKKILILLVKLAKRYGVAENLKCLKCANLFSNRCPKLCIKSNINNIVDMLTKKI